MLAEQPADLLPAPLEVFRRADRRAVQQLQQRRQVCVHVRFLRPAGLDTNPRQQDRPDRNREGRVFSTEFHATDPFQPICVVATP